MELREMIMLEKDMTMEQADELVAEMVAKLDEGHDAADLLEEQGLSADFAMDLLNEQC